METNLEAPTPVANVVGTAASETDLAAPPPAATVVGTAAADVAGSAAASAPVPVAADAIGTDFLLALDADAQTRETQLDDDGQLREVLRESPTPPALEGQPRDALATAGAPEAAVAGAVLPGSGESGAPP